MIYFIINCSFIKYEKRNLGVIITFWPTRVRSTSSAHRFHYLYTDEAKRINKTEPQSEEEEGSGNTSQSAATNDEGDGSGDNALKSNYETDESSKLNMTWEKATNEEEGSGLIGIPIPTSQAQDDSDEEGSGDDLWLKIGN